MGIFDTIKAAINANIKKNGNQEITGSILNSVMTDIVDATDAQLTELSERIDNLPKGDEFDAEGNYPSLHVGTADDLAGRGESVPASFGFRASGGKSIKDGRAYIKRIKGTSVVWNQLYAEGDVEGVIDNSDGTGYKYAKLSNLPAYTSAINGHKILAIATDKGSGIDRVYCTDNVQSNMLGGTIFNANTSAVISIMGRVPANTIANYDVTIQFYDLTQMFGAGNEPTTIEEFYARVATLGVDMNAYNEGEVIHCNTESIKSVGDNAWDEEWITGRLNTTTGQPNLGNNGITSKNYIRVLPNETYYCGYNAAPIFAIFYDAEYALITGVNGSNNFVSIRNTQFTTPANAAYMKFYVADNNLTTYNNDIMITLLHSGWKQDTDAGYQPYWQDTLPLPIIRKYFPDGMKKAGSAHDEIRYNKASGKWEYTKSKTGGGKIKSVDIGTLNYSYTNVSESYPLGYFRSTITDKAKGNNMICSKYEAVLGWTTRGIRGSDVVGVFYVKDGDYTDAESFKAAMQGVILYYEAADWEWVELDAEDQNFRDYYNVADFGTEQSQSSVPSAAFSADIIYQFNAVDMIREHEIEITELQNIIATMQAQLTSLTSPTKL